MPWIFRLTDVLDCKCSVTGKAEVSLQFWEDETRKKIKLCQHSSSLWPSVVWFSVVILCIFGIICFYGATASLANSMFGKDLMMMGPSLFTVRDVLHNSVASLFRILQGIQSCLEEFKFLSPFLWPIYCHLKSLSQYCCREMWAKNKVLSIRNNVYGNLEKRQGHLQI